MDGGGVEPTTSGLQAARGGGVKSGSIRESANPAPGIFLAKARGTPASIASFRDKPAHQARSRMLAMEKQCSWPSHPRRFRSDHPVRSITGLLCWCYTSGMQHRIRCWKILMIRVRTFTTILILISLREQISVFLGRILLQLCCLAYDSHSLQPFHDSPGRTYQWLPSWPIGRWPALPTASWSSPQDQKKSTPWSHSHQECRSCSHRSRRWTRQIRSRLRSEPILPLEPWKLPQARWGCRRTSNRLMETKSLALVDKGSPKNNAWQHDMNLMSEVTDTNCSHHFRDISNCFALSPRQLANDFRSDVSSLTHLCKASLMLKFSG